MIKSMTGYGKAEAVLETGKLTIEIKTLNGKTSDANIKTQLLPKEYFTQVKEVRNALTSYRAANFGDQARMDNELLATLIRFPDVIDNSRQDVVTEGNWPVVEKAIDEALAAVNEYRDREGAALYRDVTSRVKCILELEDQVEALEGERLQSVKERLQKNLSDLGQKVDPSRFEQ